MHKVPSGLWGYVRDDTHSVDWETEAITPCSTMSSKVHLICSWYSVGTFCLACWTGRKEGSVLMVYVPDMLYMVSKEPGKANFKVTISWATAV